MLNLYSARHYQTDEALYANFTKQTGIRINRIEGKEDELLERIRNEGANSPADVFVTWTPPVLAKAHELGLFAPVASKVLESRLPAHLRTDDWFSFSTRARVIVSNKAAVKAEDVQNYDDLANPRLKGRSAPAPAPIPTTCRSSPVIAHQGEAKAEEWARGVVANFARAPRAATRTRSSQWPPANARSPSPTPTTSPACCAPTSRKKETHGKGRRRLAQPGNHRHPHQRVRRGHAENRPGTRQQRKSSWNTWRPTTPSATLPTATTNGRRWPASRSPTRPRRPGQVQGRPVAGEEPRPCTRPKPRSSTTGPATK